MLAHLHDVGIPDTSLEQGSVKGIERCEPLRRSRNQKIMCWGFKDHGSSLVSLFWYQNTDDAYGMTFSGGVSLCP